MSNLEYLLAKISESIADDEELNAEQGVECQRWALNIFSVSVNEGCNINPNKI